jgi:hypothetical protein
MLDNWRTTMTNAQQSILNDARIVTCYPKLTETPEAIKRRDERGRRDAWRRRG